MKKLIATLLAMAMILSMAAVVSATEVADVDCTAWWAAHSAGVELKADDLVTITFTSTTYADAVDPDDGQFKFWFTPVWVLYSGNEGVVNGDGYNEYFVMRADNYGWGSACFDWANTAGDLTSYGITVESTYADGCWDNWETDVKAGVECTVTGKLVGSNAVVSIDFHGICNTLTIPVDTSSTIYVSLSGQYNKLTNISYSYASEAATGDTTTGDTTTGDTTTGDTTTGDTTTGDTTTDTSTSTGTTTDTTTGTGTTTDTTTGTTTDTSTSTGTTTDTTTGTTTDTSTSTGTTTDTTTTETEATEETKKDVEYTSLSDLDCSGWWTAHTNGVKLDEDGVIITFKNTTYSTASNNWNGPLWVLYSGDEGVVNGSGYTEYWVHRIDNYGWTVDVGYFGTAADTGDNYDAMTALGITKTESFADDFDWDTLVDALKAGVNVTVTAKLVGNNAVITMTGAGITNTMTIPVDTTKDVYLSLTGELTTLSNIKYANLADYTNAKTGDSTNLVALGAAMILAAAGIVALTKKKEF